MANYVENFSSKLDWALAFQRTGAFPLDRTDLFASYADAVKYAAGNVEDPDSRELCGTSYVGQVITVFENDTVTAYVIKSDRTLQALATAAATGDVAADLQAVTERVAALEGRATAVEGRMDTAEGKLNVLNGSGAGSVAKALADAKEYADGLDDAMDTRVQAVEDYLGTEASGAKKDLVDVIAAVATLNGDNQTVGSVKKAVADAVATMTDGDIAALQAAIEKINGTDDATSVTKKINDKVGEMKVTVNGQEKSYTTVAEFVQGVVADLVGGADGAYDTLKELQTALENDGDALSAITNTLATKADKTQLGELGTHLVDGEAVNNTVKDYVDAQVATINGTTEGIDGRVSTLEETSDDHEDRIVATEGSIATLTGEGVGSVKKAEADTKAYADGLAVNYDAAGAAAAVEAKLGEIPEGSETMRAYIDAQIESVTGDADDLEGRVATAEGKLDVLNGSGAGSVAKALADAKSYTDTEVSNAKDAAAEDATAKVNALATGAVATNASDISALAERVSDLEADTYVAILNEQIAALFA